MVPAVLASGCAYCPLAAFERSMIYLPPETAESDWQPPAGLNVEEAHFQAADGTRLHGWFLDQPGRQAVVLFAHGNADCVAYCGPALADFANRHRVAVMVFDYRGYGRSGGRPQEPGLIADAQAARAWLARRATIGEGDVVLMGQSLGGGVMTELAARDGARGLVLVSTFTSLPDVARHHMPWLPARFVMTQRYRSLARIAGYEGPLLIGHGDADRVIPVAHGEKLFAAAASREKQFIRFPGHDHNDAWPEEFHVAFEAFLAQLP